MSGVVLHTKGQKKRNKKIEIWGGVVPRDFRGINLKVTVLQCTRVSSPKQQSSKKKIQECVVVELALRNAPPPSYPNLSILFPKKHKGLFAQLHLELYLS